MEARKGGAEMKHLTVDEMMDFVSLTELNADAIMLSAAVNGHIRKCDQCLKRVQAFQMVHDEFSSLRNNGDFRKYLKSRLSKATAEQADLETYE